ncbi:fumarylacetoacetase [Silvibacterium dinghuense]|uniref:fumarylacetoacetase n=2 Tax=Silvibacterium dinghuense TaxID=1560006 RepID=A0A4Q1SK74_9BACT|nr:fumarylacetoacetase [Silvibacterium dinghuense]
MMRSWVESANTEETDFPLENLPLGVFTTGEEAARIGMAIGDRVLDLRGAARAGLFDTLDAEVRKSLEASVLNALMALGRDASRELRARVQELLADAAAQRFMSGLLHLQGAVQMCMPVVVGDYTDFYASIHHATRVGRMLRPDNPLPQSYKYLPIGYHGRASSLLASGAPIRRPWGQFRRSGEVAPCFAPTEALDYELEVGFFIGRGNLPGEPVAMADAEAHLFGACLLNDWSARDIQSWEYQPLGPFLGKNFATTISPWVVTMEALEPFRVPAPVRADGEPAVLPHLAGKENGRRGGIDLQLEVWLRTAQMRRNGQAAVQLSAANLRDLYWTPLQMLVHHTSNGCNLRAGDLFATGTVSGAEDGGRGCLLEITQRGTEPLLLPNGEQRLWLEDGDEVTLRGFCAAEGQRRIGFGACIGVVRGAGVFPLMV